MLAQSLNDNCHCPNTDLAALQHAVGLTPPHLFSPVPVFVNRASLAGMARIVRAIEAIVATPAYRDAARAWAPPDTRFGPGPRAGLVGYDFHLTNKGPRLIEVNTNPGGALLNSFLARAQRPCGESPHDPATIDDSIAAAFQSEWRAARLDAALRTIAIVDESPERQYLYREFILFRNLFERHGIHAIICDPHELERRHGRLWHRGVPIDLVYNRLTDFQLKDGCNTALRAAYLANEVVMTPDPQAHALRADKRNLTLLSDESFLRGSSVADGVVETLLAGVPRTEKVEIANEATLWAQRGQLFFKPAAGYGSKAAYRGDKITKRVWRAILAGTYVAQAVVAPSERRVASDGATLKVDIRNYVYGGEVLLVAARLYQGQTTNFRTPLGGFAPVLIGRDSCDPQCRTTTLDTQ